MKKVIIDCDPGHDDAIALFLAFGLNKLKVEAVTVVAGNQTLDKTLANALRLLTLIDEKNIKVAAGFSKPIIRDLRTAPEIHGISGLEGVELPETDLKPYPKHAVDLIIESCMASTEKIYLIPTGPLTNIAISLIKEPDIKQKIERIVLMGGSVFESNITPAAEFNIFVDPEAAKIVFESGLPITMVGLDATHKAVFLKSDVDKFRFMNGVVSNKVADILTFYISAYQEVFSFPGAPLHDALAVAEVINEGIVKTKKLTVKIETSGQYTTGRTVVDVYGITKEKPNVDVAFDLNLPLFKEMVFTAIENLDKRMNKK